MICLSSNTINTFSSHVLQVAAASYAVRVPLDPALYEDVSFVFICFTNRCGSNFIAQTLASDGRLNVASEWWNGGEIIKVCQHQNLETINRYIEGTCRFNMRSGRLLSKIGIENLVLLYQSGFFESPSLRSQFLFIERSGKLDQAISLALALETSAWAHDNEATRARSEADFSRAKIDEHMRDIIDKNRRFNEFFDMNGIAPLRINYEAFVARPDFYTKWIGKHLGIDDLRNVPANVTLKKQTDETTAAWRQRYLAGAN